MWRVGVVVVLGALGLVGCGGEDEKPVKEALEVHLQAVADGNGQAACAAATGKYQRELFSDGQDSAEISIGESCAERVEAVEEELGADNLATIADYNVEKVKINGEKATVTTKQGDGTKAECPLEKQGDDWKVSGACED